MGGGGASPHPLQLTTGLVINSSVTTSPTLAGERMLLIPKVSILSEQLHSLHFLKTHKRSQLCDLHRKQLINNKPTRRASVQCLD